jgi:hypothetical protein
LLEQHEDDISDWYFDLQDKISLKQYICSDKALSPGEDECLNEELPPTSDDDHEDSIGTSKSKGDRQEL